ncbi:hypothetical protein IMSHALPRED_003191 [Imshaugia aleurites]|uniref:Uncharacterized protein n=1 Tax=Imshaugia aleurites TaxID=172621 RepID=A0A8H3J7S5_9LECA|nr:hypothetical protein IMSHALPRED_003191 [Imshaugia aleurites]
MLFTRAFTAATLLLLTAAQTTTSLTGPEASTISSSLSAYYTSVTAQPSWSSAVAAFTSALPSSVLTELGDDPGSYVQSVITATTTQPWYTNVPASYQRYFSSIAAQEKSIVSSVVAKGPAPTNAARVAGAVLAAAGGVALVVL